MTSTIADNATAAFLREREAMLAFCGVLDAGEWAHASAAPGWRVHDVVAHLGATCRAMLTPAGRAVMRSENIERTNDAFVDTRRDRSREEVIDEYSTWSRRLSAIHPCTTRRPLARMPVRLGELGRFPLWMVSAAAPVFDHHTHLRFDIAAALGRPAPQTDANRMTVVLTWMFAILCNQLRSPDGPRVDGQIELELRGPGAMTRFIGYRNVSIEPQSLPISARILAESTEFPRWATRRGRWQDDDVVIDGDADVAHRFLDSLNIV